MSDVQVPAGWYADPVSSNVPMERHWDGHTWTRHVRPAEGVPRGPVDGPYPGAPFATSTALTTPYGETVAGWPVRAVAAFIDGLALLPLLVVVGLPSVLADGDNVKTWWNSLSDRNENPPVFDPSTGRGVVFYGSLILVTAAFHALFLHRRQATPGKLAFNLRVRRRQTPGPLPWSTIAARVGVLTAFTAGYYLVPPVALAVGALALLDVLWPLWDKNNQALHDKVAGTSVVLVPPARPDQVSDTLPA
ncbi:putative RDD family membrane protein YckC [Marmoricola sp. OAE513]|uniref:RDD family protein n=1 Tax=Marmoricola sp. OAE513 TaxID=2817894 RepID=UPI001AE39F55